MPNESLTCCVPSPKQKSPLLRYSGVIFSVPSATGASVSSDVRQSLETIDMVAMGICAACVGMVVLFTAFQKITSCRFQKMTARREKNKLKNLLPRESVGGGGKDANFAVEMTSASPPAASPSARLQYSRTKSGSNLMANPMHTSSTGSREGAGGVDDLTKLRERQSAGNFDSLRSSSSLSSSSSSSSSDDSSSSHSSGFPHLL